MGTGTGQAAPPSNAVKNVSSCITTPQMSGRSIKLTDTMNSNRQLNTPAALSTAKRHTAHAGGQLAVSHSRADHASTALLSVRNLPLQQPTEWQQNRFLDL